MIGVARDPGTNWVRADERNYADADCAIVMDHLTLQSADLGLGTCWIGAFDPAVARELLDIPADWEPISLTSLGYPADDGRPNSRTALEENVVRLGGPRFWVRTCRRGGMPFREICHRRSHQETR